MPRCFAFLRAVNVGGRVVTMSLLRRLFESAGCSNVETFIASGNVVFDTTSTSTRRLEQRLEKTLLAEVGFGVTVFVRTESELADIARHRPFPQRLLDQAAALNVGFLADAPDVNAARKVMALRTDIDDLYVHGREVYWLCRKKQSESSVSNATLERALGGRSTMRGIRTIEKMAAKYLRATGTMKRS